MYSIPVKLGTYHAAVCSLDTVSVLLQISNVCIMMEQTVCPYDVDACIR